MFLFLSVWGCCFFNTVNCDASEYLSEVYPGDGYRIRMILGDHTFHSDYELFLKQKNRTDLTFIDYEIKRYRRSKGFGVFNTVLGSLLLATGTAGIVLGSVAIADVDDCEARYRDLDLDDDGWGGEMCGLNILVGAGAIVAGSLMGMAGVVLLAVGIRKLKRANYILPALRWLKYLPDSPIQFQDLSLSGSNRTKILAVTFSF
ncbi:MAG: hypothetical protein JXX14_06510 [Deltaproteobacteria bacterium]|nr:hypothetical protein [Deltaproteobacteria bacterium]